VSAREAILGKVRNALGAASDAGRLETVWARLMNAPAGVIPARGQLAPEARVALFCEMAAKAAATVERVANEDAVPAAVTAYLRSRNLAAKVRMGGDKRLRAMPWVDERTLQVRHGPSDGDDEVAVSHAATAIAETGTLVLFSGKDNPTTLNFLPDYHIVVVDADGIGGDLETAMRLVRQRYGKGEMPRTMNFITGPSRSGDIEQKLLLGAHGPRALHVIVVGETS
jgi:L-lactate dehydrogenase complex protein LldG